MNMSNFVRIPAWENGNKLYLSIGISKLIASKVDGTNISIVIFVLYPE